MSIAPSHYQDVRWCFGSNQGGGAGCRGGSGGHFETGFKRRRPYRGTRTTIMVNLAPMIDMSFLLLIFFLVTTTFERAEGLLSSKLPRQQMASPVVALPLSPIIVHVVRMGVGEHDIALRVEPFEEAPKDVNELASVLVQILERPGFDNQTPVVIQVSDDVAWDYVVGCWNAAVRAGYKKLIFGQEKPL